MTSLRKIAFFSLTASPPAPPANEMTLRALRAAFPSHEIDVFHVVPALKKSPLTLGFMLAAASARYAPALLGGRKKLKYALFRTPEMFSWIKRWAAAKVDPDDYAFSFQMQSLFDASVPGLPHFVYTDHTHLENLRFETFREADLYSPRWIDRERSVYRNARMVFTRSSNVSESLVSQYDCPPDRVRCVYAGSNAGVPEDVSTSPERYARKAILFAGIDWERKGGPSLLAAFAKVLERHPDASLTIVGCTPDTGSLPRCTVAGRVPLSEMPRYFAEASVFCLPTRVEPFGIVFVEAMWHGLPIVATRVGAVPDMVEDGKNGFLVPPGDAQALAGRLNEILDAPDRAAAFGATSRRLAETRYDWTMVAARMRETITTSLA